MCLLDPLDCDYSERASSNAISTANAHGGGHEHGPFEGLLLLEQALLTRSYGATDTGLWIVVPCVAAFEIYVSVLAWHSAPNYIKI